MPPSWEYIWKHKCGTSQVALLSLQSPVFARPPGFKTEGGCYRGITPLVKCGMDRSAACMSEKNLRIMARLWWRNDVFLPFISATPYFGCRNLPNILHYKPSASSLKSDGFLILICNIISRQPDDNLSWQNLPQRHDFIGVRDAAPAGSAQAGRGWEGATGCQGTHHSRALPHQGFQHH